MAIIRLVPVLLATLALSACNISSLPFVYRVDIPQGNLTTEEQISQVRIGMTHDQVRFVLGTPLLVDTFHQNRWDYIYTFQPGHGELESKRMTIFFENGKVARIEHFPPQGETRLQAPDNLGPAPTKAEEAVIVHEKEAEAAATSTHDSVAEDEAKAIHESPTDDSTPDSSASSAK